MSDRDLATIHQNLAKVRNRIRNAAVKASRNADEIKLLAVSKTRNGDEILTAYKAGQKAFGENYLQEAIAKIERLSDYPLEWHFIGNIQSNKTRQIASNFDWVHGIASLKHARRLSEQRPDNLPPLQACLQINISGESSKSGIPPESALLLAQEISELPNLRLRGLMALPAPTEDHSEQRRIFNRIRELKDSISAQGIELDTLSMGMSNDLEAAIEEGATIVRIGTAIFGPRA